MSYTPRTGSKVEAAIEFIKKQGTARSAEIATAAGISSANVVNLLSTAVRAGFLVACDVTTGNRATKEYRLSATKPGSAVFDNSAFRIKPGSKVEDFAHHPKAALQQKLEEKFASGGTSTPTTKIVGEQTPELEIKPPASKQITITRRTAPRVALWSDGTIQVDHDDKTITLPAEVVSTLRQMLAITPSAN